MLDANFIKIIQILAILFKFFEKDEFNFQVFYHQNKNLNGHKNLLDSIFANQFKLVYIYVDILLFYLIRYVL